jgi:glycosyltransferase involved in cell wall biosynthesis
VTLPPARSDSRSSTFAISAFPAGVTRKENPYFTAFHQALGRRGITATDDLIVDARWLAARSGNLNAIHLHWPEVVWRLEDSYQPGLMRRRLQLLLNLIRLRRFLRASRRRGVLRIWTVHNVEPHEGASIWDRWGYRIVARETDLVVCHSESAVEPIRAQHRLRGQLIVMPMGELGSTYPPARPRAAVLESLGLDPKRPMVSCLGRLRRYKGLELACDAVGRLGGQVQLVIAGARHGIFDTRPIREAARRTPGIVFIEDKISDQQFVDLAAASDAQLLPYRKITGSAALLTALGLGRGVIASDLPYFREVLSREPEAGALVSSPTPEAWSESILEYLSRPPERRRRGAERLADLYSWDRCVDSLVQAIEAYERRSESPATAAAAPFTAREIADGH